MASPASFNSLSSELLLMIAEILHHSDHSSLPAFARINSFCYAASTPFIFNQIKFSVTSRQCLWQDVKECTLMLRRAEAFRHVRTVFIDGKAPKEDEYHDSQYRWKRPRLLIAEEVFDDEEYLLDPGDSLVHFPPKLPPHAVYQTDNGWMPLATLLGQLSWLKDLVFACSTQFPPCLLDALHRYHPQCRLHLHTFRLHSMNMSVTDQHEYNLVTSPCLYSICADLNNIIGFRLDSWPVYITEPELEMLVRGMAPNLKKFRCFKFGPAVALGRDPPDRNPKIGFTQDQNKGVYSRGSLDYLQIVNLSGFTKQNFHDWNRNTDLSLLRVLRLDPDASECAIEYLESNFDFPNLRVLELRPPSQARWMEAIRPFLEKLTELVTFKLNSWTKEFNLFYLEHLGPKLRRLELLSDLRRDISLEQFQSIAGLFPQLESLRIEVNRTLGNSDEIAIYKAIGACPKLQSLTLELNAFSLPIIYRSYDRDRILGMLNHPDFDEDDKILCPQIRLFDRWFAWDGHVRHALTNAALDGKLACEIFRAVSSGKPSNALPLETLEVKSKVAGGLGLAFVTVEYTGIIEHVSRSTWVVKRSQRDDRRDELRPRETYQRPPDPNFDGFLAPWMEKVFRRLWPNTQGTGFWEDDWSSISLDSYVT